MVDAQLHTAAWHIRRLLAELARGMPGGWLTEEANAVVERLTRRTGMKR
jgi:hypothetical protein